MADQFSLEKSSHGKAFSFAWDAASSDAGLRKRNKPLDEEWISHCWRKSLLGTRISYVEYRNFVREVERAHDIKEN